jgi:hypothetical protein
MGYADAAVGGESFDAVIKVLDMMKKDAHKSVIDEEEFFKSAKEKDDEKRALEFENEHLKKELDGAMAMLNSRSVQEPILITRIACPESNINKPVQEPILITRIACPESNINKPAQEPVAWIVNGSNLEWSIKPNWTDTIPLYTHPHQWQGLTHD